jgi:CheY-like chemotaxis protein
MSAGLAPAPGGQAVTEVRSLARVLCVDDEPRVLEGIALNLRKRYEVLTASSGAAALDILGRTPIAVVLCDMRMPGMDGNQFLQRARQLSPDTVRVLLTGQADLKSAMTAVNEGQVFRFLTKPCPPTVLLPTLEAAVEQHRRQTSEKALLEQTLHGAIKALGDVLALTNPIAFERATRVGRYVTSMAATLPLAERWSVEVAAMVSQLGFITLPSELVDRIHLGEPLTDAETDQVAQVPLVTERLLAHIPRLEGVREILAGSARPARLPDGADAATVQTLWASHTLAAALAYDALTARGLDAHAAVAAVRERDLYATEVLDALAACVLPRPESQPEPEPEPDREMDLPLSELRVGMVILENVQMTSGAPLVGHGFEVTANFLGRVRNLRPGAVQEPIRVLVRGTATSAPKPGPPEVPL